MQKIQYKKSLGENMKEVLNVLELNIGYEIVHHEEVFTTEEADAAIEGKEGIRSKTLFLTKKRN